MLIDNYLKIKKTFIYYYYFGKFMESDGEQDGHITLAELKSMFPSAQQLFI